MVPVLETIISKDSETYWFVGTVASNYDAVYVRVTSSVVIPISVSSVGAIVASNPVPSTVVIGRADPPNVAPIVHASGYPAVVHSSSYACE